MSKKLPSGGHVALDVPLPDVSSERASSTSCARDSEAGKQLSEEWARQLKTHPCRTMGSTKAT